MATKSEPSILLQRADSIALCLKELESIGHKAQALSITEDYALISIAYSPNAKKLHGCYRGIIGGSSGRFTVYQVKLHGVFVQWLVPYFDAQQSARVN